MGLADRLKQLFADARPQADRAASERVSAAAEAAVLVERRKKPRVNPPDGTKVLVVDDSPTIVTMISRMLEQNDFIILEASDGARGVEIAHNEIPDIIFLDIVMPGMTGFQALRALRRDPTTKHIPIVMISGNEQATEQFYLQRIGANDFMKKPFSRAEVFSRIERLLDLDKLPRRFQEAALPGAASLLNPSPHNTGVIPVMTPAPRAPLPAVPTTALVEATETLDLSGKGIAALGSHPVPARICCVFLDSNRLDGWPTQLDAMTGLQRLSLYDNQLADVPDRAGQLSGLRHLNLGNNQLTSLPPSVCRLTALESLNLSQNRIAVLPESIDALPRLRMLDLGHNALTVLPAALGRLPQLTQFLYLGHNHIREISEALCSGWSRLGYLNLSENELSTLPETLGAMLKLVELRLYNNNIDTLPESIGKLSRLQELHLDHNRIVVLPQSIGELHALKELRLANNALTSLPASIDGLTNLRRLDLRDNRLASLPDAIGRLPQLTHLDLRGNALISLPEGISTLPQLQKLDLRWNRLLDAPAWLPALRERGCVVYI
jgi:Leucine-rich repeat (LRR) protein